MTVDEQKPCCSRCGVKERRENKRITLSIHECVGCGKWLCKQCYFRHVDFGHRDE